MEEPLWGQGERIQGLESQRGSQLRDEMRIFPALILKLLFILIPYKL